MLKGSPDKGGEQKKSLFRASENKIKEDRKMWRFKGRKVFEVAILSAVIILAFCVLVLAQDEQLGVLDGAVADSTTRAPISGADIYIGGRHLVSDASGAFSTSFPPGDYQISVQALSYCEDFFLGWVEIMAGKTTPYVVFLDAPHFDFHLSLFCNLNS